ncbi:hypothetical protein [Arthrobacter roseus]|uniref:hypothetical protein n=1 Tax=Arthrobacter roseus TaxID=136274 RepID=UPI001966083B|nr:hypothetical protein [Arthrobacter roseus]MBM7847500.1 hypothetical protein [Arthrobacter roseus]
MNTDAETRFMEIYHDRSIGPKPDASLLGAVQQFLTEYAVIPRDQMPVLDEDGKTPAGWWVSKASYKDGASRRIDAAFFLARAEWFDAKETREAEAKLSERRNKVLGKIRARRGSTCAERYEELNPDAWSRITVDMVIEAQDGAGK